MSKRNSLLIVLPLLALLLGGLWYGSHFLAGGVPVTANPIEAVDRGDDNPSVSNSNEEVSHIKEAQQVIAEWKLVGTPQEEAEQAAWLGVSGNYYGVTEYDSYDVETLKKLAETGDLHAMHKLANWYVSDQNFLDYGFKFAEPLLWRAAIYGSSGAISELAEIQYSKRYGNDSEEEKRQLLLDAMAFYRAAELRGDRWGTLTIKKSLMKNNNFSFASQELDVINKRAQEIYSDLQSQRLELGLGEFDNSVSPAVKKLFEIMENPPGKKS